MSGAILKGPGLAQFWMALGFTFRDLGFRV